MTFQQAVKKVCAFAELTDGWNFGDGCRFSAEVVTIALSFLVTAVRVPGRWTLEEFDAFPASDGGILITFYFAATHIELTIGPDVKIGLTFCIDDNEILEVQDMTRDEARTVLESVITTLIEAPEKPVSPEALQKVAETLLEFRDAYFAKSKLAGG